MKSKHTGLFLIMYFSISFAGFTQTVSYTAKSDSLKYATVIIYRPHDRGGRNNAFKVNIGDSSFKVRDNNSSEIKIYKEGELVVTCNKETSAEVKINIKFGEQYYVRCILISGIITARPILTLVRSEVGEDELIAIRKRKK